MSATTKQPIAIACLFTWIGFVCAISFLEAWLKFRAPGVSLPIGLGIGRLVFAALNRVEWFFAIVVLASALLYSKSMLVKPNLSLLFVVVILVLQTAWLLPTLDIRAELYIRGQAVGPSNLHLWFIAAEVLKVINLFITAVSLFKSS